MSEKQSKYVSNGVNKRAVIYDLEDEDFQLSRCQSFACHRRYLAKRVDPLQANDFSLTGRMFSCIPYWLKKRPHSHQTVGKRYSDFDVTSTDDDEVEVNDILYSEEEEIIPEKKISLQAKESARKIMKQKLKKRKETCKLFKMKAKDIEKQFEIFEKEKIKRKREAIRKAHKMKREKLMREQKLLIEKEKMELLKLKIREKNIKKHMKSLKKRLRAKCKSIYFVESSEELSNSCSLDRISAHKNNHSESRSTRNKENTRGRNPGPSKSDEDVGRVLNTLLCTNIDFDSDIITKIKNLLKAKPKLQGYFNECSHNNNNNSLTNHLKYKLFSRVGFDSKLKFFLNSKKRMNAEHRELLRAIMEQVNREYGEDENKKKNGDTMLNKIYKILWRKAEGHSAGAPGEHQSQRIPQVQEQTYPGTSYQNSRHRKVYTDNAGYSKKTTKGNKKVCQKISLAENTVQNITKNIRSTNKTTRCLRGQKSKSQVCNIMKNKGRGANVSCSLHESRPFALGKLRVDTITKRTPEPHTNKSSVEEEIRHKKLEETRQPTVVAAQVATPEFNLMRIFKSAPNKNKSTDEKYGKNDDNNREYNDMALNGRQRQCQRKCARCVKTTETDIDSESFSELDQSSDVSENNSEELNQGKKEKNTEGGKRFWNLFNRDQPRGDGRKNTV